MVEEKVTGEVGASSSLAEMTDLICSLFYTYNNMFSVIVQYSLSLHRAELVYSNCTM